jgi:hypothetical protein
LQRDASPTLNAHLQEAYTNRFGRSSPGVGVVPVTPERKVPREDKPPNPVYRHLRGYAFDPEMSTRLETAHINEVVYEVPWEERLKPGPSGEYVEVIDHDPASGCFYAPVNLNEAHLLAASG